MVKPQTDLKGGVMTDQRERMRETRAKERSPPDRDFRLLSISMPPLAFPCSSEKNQYR